MMKNLELQWCLPPGVRVKIGASLSLFAALAGLLSCQDNTLYSNDGEFLVRLLPLYDSCSESALDIAVNDSSLEYRVHHFPVEIHSNPGELSIWVSCTPATPPNPSESITVLRDTFQILSDTVFYVDCARCIQPPD